MTNTPSEYARSRIGHRVKYETDEPGHERGPTECIIEDVRLSGSTIENLDTGRSWPGIQFKMRPTDGGPTFWSATFPDRSPDEHAPA